MTLKNQKNGAMRLAIVFDFDDTLASDSTSGFLESMGVDVEEFWRRHAALSADGWDPIPAYLQMMIDESRSRKPGKRFTRQRLQAWGKKIKLHDGVSTVFGRLRKQAQAINSKIEVEFFVVSSGIGECLRHSTIAKNFTDIWASDFDYNAAGEIVAAKRIVSFTDKTRFLFQISKGIIGPASRRDPFAVNKKVDERSLYVPMEQMIFVGDGFTDIPCFSMVQKSGGVAIGVYDRRSREKWGKAWGYLDDKRVMLLVAADFRRQSGLDDALLMAIDKVSRNITLRGMTYQG